MNIATLRERHCWGFPDSKIPKCGPALASFPHADPSRGAVTLHRDAGGRLWGCSVQTSCRQDDRTADGRDGLVREWFPLPWTDPKGWGEVREARCHTADPRHPWNEGRPRPGFHACGACGYPAWLEWHGVAAGRCECCGYDS